MASGVPGATADYTRKSMLRSRVKSALEHEIIAADQFRWTILLSRFEELLPADVSIRSIQPDFNGHSVRLACLARDVSAMTRFVDNLLTSEDLSQAYLQAWRGYIGSRVVASWCRLVSLWLSGRPSDAFAGNGRTLVEISAGPVASARHFAGLEPAAVCCA